MPTRTHSKGDERRSDIDWVIGTTTGQIPIDDPDGITIIGNGGNDTINLSYSNGNPLPNLLKIVQPQGGTPAVNDVTINGLDSGHLLCDLCLLALPEEDRRAVSVQRVHASDRHLKTAPRAAA